MYKKKARMDWKIKIDNNKARIVIDIPGWELDYLREKETKEYFQTYFMGECNNILNILTENINRKENK